MAGAFGKITQIISHDVQFRKIIDITVGNGLFSITKREVKAMQAYCVKCKAIVMKNGRPATQGVCPTCGTKMFRIGKS